jgi:hypothetical protein
LGGDISEAARACRFYFSLRSAMRALSGWGGSSALKNTTISIPALPLHPYY